jgi:hypothetical protein
MSSDEVAVTFRSRARRQANLSNPHETKDPPGRAVGSDDGSVAHDTSRDTKWC